MRSALFLSFVVSLLGTRAEHGARADDAPPAPPGAPAPARAVVWTDVSARVAKRDAPIYAQVRVAADGGLSVRSRPSGGKDWEDQAVRALGSEPKAQTEALKSLYAALEHVLPADKDREQDGTSKALLLLDVEAGVPWRHVQWVVMTACASKLKVYRLCFVGFTPGETIDVDLPRDRGISAAPVAGKPGTSIVARLFRTEGETPAQAFTRIKLSATPVTLDDVGLPSGEDTETIGGPDEAPPELPSIDLLPAASPADAVAAKWAEVEKRLRAEVKPDRPLVGEIKAPAPTGSTTPYGDVFRVMQLLRKVGAGTILFEGTASPLPRSQGGGWDFR